MNENRSAMGRLSSPQACQIGLQRETGVGRSPDYETEGELPPDNHIAFAVADVDSASEALMQNGMTLEAPPQDYYWGRSAYLRDPDGQQIELINSANPAKRE